VTGPCFAHYTATHARSVGVARYVGPPPAAPAKH